MIGQQMRVLRKSQSLSLADVAATLNMSIATLSRIETGKQSVDLATFVRIAKVLKTTPAALLGDGEGDPASSAVDIILSLPREQRAGVWEAVARKNKQMGNSAATVAEAVDELLAQIDMLTTQLAIVKKGLR